MEHNDTSGNGKNARKWQGYGEDKIKKYQVAALFNQITIAAVIV